MAEELKPLNIEEWRDGLKQCPLCNTTKMLKVDIVGGLKVEGCDYCGIFVMKGHWNTRPIEEALEDRVRELEEIVRRIADDALYTPQEIKALLKGE